jgi:hypothetical protein
VCSYDKMLVNVAAYIISGLVCGGLVKSKQSFNMHRMNIKNKNKITWLVVCCVTIPNRMQMVVTSVWDVFTLSEFQTHVTISQREKPCMCNVTFVQTSCKLCFSKRTITTEYVYCLRYPVWHAHAPCCQLWPYRLNYIFPHVLNCLIFGNNLFI